MYSHVDRGKHAVQSYTRILEQQQGGTTADSSAKSMMGSYVFEELLFVRIHVIQGNHVENTARVAVE